MNGAPPLLLIFIAAFTYAMVESKRKGKTALYTAIVMGFILAVGFVLSLILPGMSPAMGTLTAPIILITGAITSIAHDPCFS